MKHIFYILIFCCTTIFSCQPKESKEKSSGEITPKETDEQIMKVVHAIDSVRIDMYKNINESGFVGQKEKTLDSLIKVMRGIEKTLDSVKVNDASKDYKAAAAQYISSIISLLDNTHHKYIALDKVSAEMDGHDIFAKSDSISRDYQSNYFKSLNTFEDARVAYSDKNKLGLKIK